MSMLNRWDGGTLMNRLRWLMPALALTMLFPVGVAAQKYKDNKFTDDADKFIGLALLRPDRESRQEMYRQALAALEGAFADDPENARVWFVAGQAHAGAGDFIAADTCFDRALSLYPDLTAEIEGEREQAWLDGFQMGVELMDVNNFDEALATLETAQQMYNKRPEALLNIGSIYANRGELEQAEGAFERAIEATRSDVYEKLDSLGQSQWDSYAEMSTLNIAQMRGTRGVNAFSEGDYDTAAEMFAKAIEINPYSRDYFFNRLQATYARASDLESSHEAAPEDAAIKSQLQGLYSELLSEIPRIREFDPTSENLELIRARAVKREGELRGDTTAAREAALKILEDLELMPVEIQNLAINPGIDGVSVTVSGMVRNRTLATGSSVGVEVILMGATGQTVGQVNFSVTTGENVKAFIETCLTDEANIAQVPDELDRDTFCRDKSDDATASTFEQSSELLGQIAGWKYSVRTD